MCPDESLNLAVQIQDEEEYPMLGGGLSPDPYPSLPPTKGWAFVFIIPPKSKDTFLISLTLKITCMVVAKSADL